MKIDTKSIFIFIIVIVFGFIYAEIEDKRVNNKKEDIEPVIVEDNSDAVKLKVDGNLNVYYLNVGQADAVLVENNGLYMLIDAGNNGDGKELVDYFNSLGIKKFEYVIASHPHEDHIGGMDDILNNFDVEHFYMPDVVTTTKTFEDVITALENNEIALETPEIGSIFILGGCKFEVLYVGEEGSDLNDTSIVIRGLYGNNSFLFMGDAPSGVEKELLDDNIDSDVLKVGHHGSKYSSSVKFLNEVTPDYAIISAGEGNSYNHPHDVALERLADCGAKIYRTDTDGTILATSDGDNITFKLLDVELNG